MKALITGIGKSMARKLGSRGWELILTGRNEAALEQLKSELGSVETIVADLSKREDVFKVYDFCKDKGVDMLVNNAGYGIFGRFDKTDLDDDIAARSELNDVLPEGIPVVAISAKRDSDIEALRELIVNTASMPDVEADAVIVTNARHYEALIRAREALTRAIDGLNSGLSGDLLDQDIRECLHWLGEITGEITTDNILGEIFAHFCIGK